MDVLAGYIPIFLFMGLTFLFPIVTLLVAKLIRPQTGGTTERSGSDEVDGADATDAVMLASRSDVAVIGGGRR